MNKTTEKLIDQFATRLAWRVFGPAIVALALLAVGFILAMLSSL